MRINFFGKVTSSDFKVRGKDIYRSLNSLKNYVSISNRPGEMAIVLKRHEDPTTNEVIASLKTTNFNDYIEEIDEVDSAEAGNESEADPDS